MYDKSSINQTLNVSEYPDLGEQGLSTYNNYFYLFHHRLLRNWYLSRDCIYLSSQLYCSGREVLAMPLCRFIPFLGFRPSGLGLSLGSAAQPHGDTTARSRICLTVSFWKPSTCLYNAPIYVSPLRSSFTVSSWGARRRCPPC